MTENLAVEHNNPTHQEIQQLLMQHKIVLFMKGTPAQPRCGFSATVVQCLHALNVPFHSVDVLENDAIRSGIKTYAQWPTIPQLYIHGEFVGGCDIVREMYMNGELKAHIEAK
jgi:monothiol glutaredoxin